jgi:NAD-dependent SIR2 family protein deacetylase
MAKDEWKTILSIGMENGTIDLKEKKTLYGNCSYRQVITEMEEGMKHFSSAETKNEAMALMDKYSWLSLFPLYIEDSIKTAVQKRILNHRYRNESVFDAWVDSCFAKKDEKKVKLANWILTSKKTMVLTGAGMSTESNLPDFRSEKGWWRQIDPRTVATPEALYRNYSLFADFYAGRIEALTNTAPHVGHLILATLEEQGLIDGIATQNVDGLHKKAGNEKVYELHGSLDEIYCHDCGKQATFLELKQKSRCGCGGRLRPGVVLFGEMLPKVAWTSALEEIETADLVLVIGTSLEVYPANQLHSMTKGRTVYINTEINEQAGDFDLCIEGKAKEILESLNDYLQYDFV